MSSKENLEKKMSQKKTIEDVMHKYLGISIKELNDDITAKISNPLLDFDVDKNLSLNDAKDQFIKRYIIRILNKNSGNVTLASKEAGISRRSMHRFIQKFNINTESLRDNNYNKFYFTPDKINDIIEDSLKKYEGVIHPLKMSSMYKNVSEMTQNILDKIPYESSITLKKALFQFEKDFIKKTLENHKNNISLTAKSLGIRYETLHRKLKSFNS